jgi:hypothetical protein
MALFVGEDNACPRVLVMVLARPRSMTSVLKAPVSHGVKKRDAWMDSCVKVQVALTVAWMWYAGRVKNVSGVFASTSDSLARTHLAQTGFCVETIDVTLLTAALGSIVVPTASVEMASVCLVVPM